MRKVLLCSLLFLIPCAIFAQSRESAEQDKNALQAGAEFSEFNPDFYCTSNSPFHCSPLHPLIKGVGVVVDYNTHGRYSGEAEARWLHWDGAEGQVESNYFIGPRYRFYRWNKFDFWAKFLVGIGSITTEGYPSFDTLKGNFFVYSPGAVADYRITRKLTARVDYEYQRWPGFALLPPHNHGLSPNGLSYGVEYTLLGR